MALTGGRGLLGVSGRSVQAPVQRPPGVGELVAEGELPFLPWDLPRDALPVGRLHIHETIVGCTHGRNVSIDVSTGKRTFVHTTLETVVLVLAAIALLVVIIRR